MRVFHIMTIFKIEKLVIEEVSNTLNYGWKNSSKMRLFGTFSNTEIGAGEPILLLYTILHMQKIRGPGLCICIE